MRLRTTILALALGLVLLALPSMAATGPTPRIENFSKVDGLKFTPLKSLPKAPAVTGLEWNCQGVGIEHPKTAGGAAAAARGWVITTENSLGAYEVVSFASAFTAGTSGTCETQDGNVGIFRGGDLIAIRSLGGVVLVTRFCPDGHQKNIANEQPNDRKNNYQARHVITSASCSFWSLEPRLLS